MDGKRIMKKVLVRAPSLSMSGYGEQARFLLKVLRSREDLYDVYIDDIPWGQTGAIIEDDSDINWIKSKISKFHKNAKNNADSVTYDMSIQVTIPNEWKKLAPVNIGYTAGIECDRVTPEWIHFGNIMDKIITISKHSEDVYKSSVYQVRDSENKLVQALGLKTEIDYLGYCVRNISADNNFSLELETDFNILSISQFGPRKNTKNTLKWFLEEFHDDDNVGLVLKTHVKNCSTMDKIYTTRIIEEIIKEYPNKKCKIYLIHGDMTKEEMCSLYRHPKIKSYLTFTHGEGFGLPIFEAVCNGLPVIAPGWSGHVDYLYGAIKKKKKVTVKPLFCKVPFVLKQVNKDAVFRGVISPEAKWCFVESIAARRSMRNMYKNFSMYSSWAKKLQKQTLEKFSEEKMINLFLEKLSVDDSLGEPIQKGEVHVL